MVLADVLAPDPAENPPTAVFALVVGSNHSVDEDKPPLRYADDDAARFFDLYRALGAHVFLVSRLDEDTKRLHTQAAAEARAPLAHEWSIVATELAEVVQQAQTRGLRTELHVVFAGHGDEVDGAGALELEDRRISGDELLREIIETAGASRTHVIIDACHSFAFAYAGPRGPGGERRPVAGFSRRSLLANAEGVGLLLSSSSTRETHEWEVVQSGIFSHVLRSGMLGAADADGDSQVSYREIAAFVERAAVAIPNERFRPRVHVDPPDDTNVSFLDLRPAMKRRLETDDTATPGHHYIENSLGVRLGDFHASPGQKVRLIRPPGFGRLYVRQASGEKEYVVPNELALVRLDERRPTEVRVAARGAAHNAFEHLFALPFGEGTVENYSLDTRLAAQKTLMSPPERERTGSLSLGYVLGSAYLKGADLRHGVGLSYGHAFGRLRVGASVTYAHSAYKWARTLDVRAHEIGAAFRFDGKVLRLSWLDLSLGLEAGGGRVFQLGSLPDAPSQEASGWFFRYRAVLCTSFPILDPLAWFFEVGAGQTILRSAGSLRAPFDAGFSSGLSLSL